MTSPLQVHPRSTSAVALSLLLLLTQACSKGDGLSDYERTQKKSEDAREGIRAMGGSVEVVHYPQGDGFGIKLSGAQISDDLFGYMKQLRRVAELDLSRSSITDEQLSKLNEFEVGTLVVKLDLSHTAVTDAGLENLTALYVLRELKAVGTKV